MHEAHTPLRTLVNWKSSVIMPTCKQCRDGHAGGKCRVDGRLWEAKASDAAPEPPREKTTTAVKWWSAQQKVRMRAPEPAIPPICADCVHSRKAFFDDDSCTHPLNAIHRDKTSGELPLCRHMRDLETLYPNKCGKAGRLFEPKAGAFKSKAAKPYRPEPEPDIHESQRDYGTRSLPKPRKRSRFWPMLALFFADPDQWNERMNQWLHRRLGEKHE